MLAIMDDDPGFARALARVLGALGQPARHVVDLRELLAVFRAGEVRCLVVDVELGPLSGFDVVRHVRQHWPAQPAVFMTGHGNPAYAGEARALGCLAYLEKPFEVEALLAALATVAPAAP